MRTPPRLGEISASDRLEGAEPCQRASRPTHSPSASTVSKSRTARPPTPTMRAGRRAQRSLQRIANPRRIEVGSTRLRDHHDVDVRRQRLPSLAEPFAYASLHVVSRHRVSDLAADRETESSHGCGIDARDPALAIWACRGHQDHEFGRCVPSGRPRDAPIVDRSSDAILAPKTSAAGLHDPVGVMIADGKPHRAPRQVAASLQTRLLRGHRCGEALASLRPSALQDGPPGLGLHARSKAVLPKPLDATRLIRSLHLSLLRSGRARPAMRRPSAT